MAINFNSFQEGTTSNIQSNDYVVGFDTAVPNGERKFTISTLANAVSGIMNAQLDADIANATNTTVLSTSLSAAPFSAKAWVNFDGTFATSPFTVGSGIRKAYNVSSVTRLAAGDYQINFTTPMSDSNYAVVTGCFNAETSNSYSTTANINYTTMTTSSCVIKIYFYTSNDENVEYVGAAFFN